MTQKTYRLEELQTTGWEIVEPLGKYEGLTKEQAQEVENRNLVFYLHPYRKHNLNLRNMS